LDAKFRKRRRDALHLSAREHRPRRVQLISRNRRIMAAHE
jgi:hypothetical protein